MPKNVHKFIIVSILPWMNVYSNADIFDWSNLELFQSSNADDQEVEEIKTEMVNILQGNKINNEILLLLRNMFEAILIDSSEKNIEYYLKQAYKLIKNEQDPSVAQLDKVRSALNSIYQGKKGEIEQAIRLIQQTHIGNMLFNAIGKYCGGGR